MTGFSASNIHFLPYHQYLDPAPAEKTGIIVVIPACCEPDIGRTIESLRQCSPPSLPVEIIVVINAAVNASEETLRVNRETFSMLSREAARFSDTSLSLLPVFYENLPERVAGAGLARRLGFDEAARRFALCGNADGVIASLDADTMVDPGYLKALEETFKNGSPDVAVIYFEHPLTGTQFPPTVYRGIVQYELHLRYVVQALRFIGYPFAYHTVGSAFSVTAQAYVREGGMNVRQAGEDFYFLQKIFKSGKVAEINHTCVYPSPRPSDRVPFGTGPEMLRFIRGEKETLMTYVLDAFVDLKALLAFSDSGFQLTEKGWAAGYDQLPSAVRSFLKRSDFMEKMREIKNNVATPESFSRRFYRWFDTFRVIKYLNFVHSTGSYTKQPVAQQASLLLQRRGDPVPEDTIPLLAHYRKLDRRVL